MYIELISYHTSYLNNIENNELIIFLNTKLPIVSHTCEKMTWFSKLTTAVGLLLLADS